MESEQCSLNTECVEDSLSEALKAVSEKAGESSSMMSKQLETELAESFEEIFAEFMYKTSKLSEV